MNFAVNLFSSFWCNLEPSTQLFQVAWTFWESCGINLREILRIILIAINFSSVAFGYCLFHCMAWLQDKGFKSLSLLAKGKIISSLTALQIVQFTVRPLAGASKVWVLILTVHTLPAYFDERTRGETSNWLSVFPYCRSFALLNVISVWQTLMSGAV